MTQPVCYFNFFLIPSYTCISQNPTIAKHAVCWLMFWFSPMTCSHSVTYGFVNYSNNKRIKNDQFTLFYFLEELTSLMNCLQAPHGEIKRSSRSLLKRQLRNITQHYLCILQFIHPCSYTELPGNSNGFEALVSLRHSFRDCSPLSTQSSIVACILYITTCETPPYAEEP